MSRNGLWDFSHVNGSETSFTAQRLRLGRFDVTSPWLGMHAGFLLVLTNGKRGTIAVEYPVHILLKCPVRPDSGQARSGLCVEAFPEKHTLAVAIILDKILQMSVCVSRGTGSSAKGGGFSLLDP